MTKNYLPLLQQIDDSLKKIGLVGTLVMGDSRQLQIATVAADSQNVARVPYCGGLNP